MTPSSSRRCILSGLDPDLPYLHPEAHDCHFWPRRARSCLRCQVRREGSGYILSVPVAKIQGQACCMEHAMLRSDLTAGIRTLNTINEDQLPALAWSHQSHQTKYTNASCIYDCLKWPCCLLILILRSILSSAPTSVLRVDPCLSKGAPLHRVYDDRM